MPLLRRRTRNRNCMAPKACLFMTWPFAENCPQPLLQKGQPAGETQGAEIFPWSPPSVCGQPSAPSSCILTCLLLCPPPSLLFTPLSSLISSSPLLTPRFSFSLWGVCVSLSLLERVRLKLLLSSLRPALCLRISVCLALHPSPTLQLQIKRSIFTPHPG